MRILIIEDEKTQVEIYEAILSDEHEIVSSLDVNEIQTLIPTVDLVISDYYMDGVAFSDIEDACVRAQVELLVVSGARRETFKPEIRLLSKPFSIADLQTAISDSVAA